MKRQFPYGLSNYIPACPVAKICDIVAGYDIFGLSPGPKVGQLLKAVIEAQAVGEVNSRQQAIEYVKRSIDKETQHYLSERTRGET